MEPQPAGLEESFGTQPPQHEQSSSFVESATSRHAQTNGLIQLRILVDEGVSGFHISRFRPSLYIMVPSVFTLSSMWPTSEAGKKVYREASIATTFLLIRKSIK